MRGAVKIGECRGLKKQGLMHGGGNRGMTGIFVKNGV